MTRARPPIFRPVAPDPAQLVRWPDDFGTRFVVMVDTEEEFDWAQPLSRANRSVRAMHALPAAHTHFTQRGVGPIYLIDHPVVTSPVAVDILKQLLADGRSAVGTQLHPWVNPPYDEAITPENSFAGNLPYGLEDAKIEALTDAIAKQFGSPQIFRAGRYGLGPNTATSLERHGYRISSSMRARYDYSAIGGPDYRAIDNAAFRSCPTSRIVEIPLTTIYTGKLRTNGARIHPSIIGRRAVAGLAARTGLLSRVALTPEDMPVGDALEAVRCAVGDGVQLLNFSFHSPTVAPGHTRFVRDETELASFHRWWDAVFDLLDRLGVRNITHDALIDTLDRTT